MTERFVAMTARDRAVRGEPVVGIVGPLTVPSRDAFVDALRRLASFGPKTRVGLGFAAGGGWVIDDRMIEAWCDEIVVETAPATAATVREVATSFLALLDDEHPLRFVLAGDYVIQLNDHSLGDGVLLIDRLSTVIAWASGDEAVPAWVTAPVARRPVITALRATFRTASARRALMQNRSMNTARADAGSPVAPGTDTAATAPWTPQQSVVSVVVPPTSMRLIQAMMKASDPRPSISGVLISLLRRAFESADFDVHPETTTLFNLRRYLPETLCAVDGNFVTGLPLRVDTPDDAVQISEALKAQGESGRPLAAHAVGLVRSMFAQTSATHVTGAPAHPRVRLVFNSMGVVRPFDRLPWSAPTGERTCTFMVRPGGPEHVTVTIVMVGGAAYVDASFHSNVFDPAHIRLALDRLSADPASLSGTTVATA